jgi:hypothetical protein
MTDDRSTCTACANFTRGWCSRAIAAGMSRSRDRAEIGPTLAALLQRCPAFTARKA